MRLLVGGPPAIESEVERVLDALALREDELAEAMLAEILAEIATYSRSPSAALADEVRDHCRRHVDLLLSCLRERRDPDRGQLEFAREQAAQRVHQGIPLEGLLQAFRVGHRTLWEAIVAQAGTSPAGREAAVGLAGAAMDYIDLACTHVAEAYLKESGRLAERVQRQRRDLFENLLGGRLPETDAETRAVAPRLDPEGEMFVAVAAIDAEAASDAHALARAAEVIVAYVSAGSLVVVRQDEVAAVVPMPAGGTEAIGASLRAARDAAEREHDLRIVVGVGGICHGHGEVARRYLEAHQALRRADSDQPVVALAELSPFEHLVAASDGSTLGSVGERAAVLFDSAGPGGAPLIETLRAYLEADLDVGETAKALFVHPNTVRYRMRRISDLTGFDTQSFSGLVELLAITRASAASAP